MNRIKRNRNDYNLNNLIGKFSLLIEHNSIVLSAAGFFDINVSLITAVKDIFNVTYLDDSNFIALSNVLNFIFLDDINVHDHVCYFHSI